METHQSATDKIIKEEAVGYLKSKLNLQQGTLTLTDKKLSLSAHKTGVSGGGLLGFFLKKAVEKPNTIFDLEFNTIKSVSQGTHGMHKNILEITDMQDVTHRLLVKDWQEWLETIQQKKTI